MKVKASVCGAIVTLAIVCIAGGHGKEGSRAADGASEPALQEKLDVYGGQLKHGSVVKRRQAVLALGRLGERAKAVCTFRSLTTRGTAWEPAGSY